MENESAISADVPAEDMIKIMIATDNHLGYGEKDPVRDMDSFNTFEEILQLAVQSDVDFILLGGDLFHESRPSPFCLTKCTELLKKYCLGDKPIAIEFLSDPSVVFQNSRNGTVNYEDPNLNIAYPVFSIHGNHDDPAGHQQVSALDLLSSSGLINYFGKWNDYNNVEINPICMRKGETKLALYGLSHMKDERLGRLFRDKKVTIHKPESEDWFNLMVIHQNRAERGPKNYIPATCIPNFIDIVIWGHEHDCRLKPEPSGSSWISQPGSSVATSLSIGESLTKEVGILEIYKDAFHMNRIPLETVRPFMFAEISFADPDSDDYIHERPQEQAIDMIKAKMEELIEEAKEKQHPNRPRLLPIIRVIGRYYNERQQFNHIRLGSTYQNRIANPQDCIMLKPLRARKKLKAVTTDAFLENENDDFKNVHEWAKSIVDVVKKHLEEEECHQLELLSIGGVTEAITRYVDCSDTYAMEELIRIQTKKVLDKLMTDNITPDDHSFEKALEKLQGERNAVEDLQEVRDALASENRTANRSDDFSDNEDEVQIVEDNDKPSRPTRGKGSRGPRASTSAGRRGSRGSRGRAAKAT